MRGNKHINPTHATKPNHLVDFLQDNDAMLNSGNKEKHAQRECSHTYTHKTPHKDSFLNTQV